jgi:hypothetical protein
MQFMPSGSQPRRGRNPRTEPDVRVGPEHQQHAAKLTLGMPKLHVGSIRKTF